MQAQLDPGKVSLSISHIESRLRQIKRAMEELLYSLELQDQVSYSDMISKFSSLASEFSALQAAIKKSALPSGVEDNGNLLKTHLIVPQRVSIIPDDKLQNISEGRLVSWNHEVIPVYLRTKLNPEVEEDERKIESERSRQTWEHLSKQIVAFNKHIESLSTRLNESSRQSNERQRERPAFSTDETVALVKAVCRGIGIQARSSSAASSSTLPNQEAAARMGGSSNSRNVEALQMGVPIVKLK